MIEKFNISFKKNIVLNKPFGFKKFLNLEKYAKCVLSDS
jgi:UDP-N-acetylglucosamine 2-epimerase